MKSTRLSIILWTAVVALAPAAAEEKVDLHVVHRIKSEALQNSKVMEHLFQLTDVHGPRLTGSPAFQAAAEWAVKQLRGWGCENVKLEKWGRFGKGWSLVRFTGHLVEPQRTPLIGFPLAWTPGTGGPVSGEPVLAPLPIRDSDEGLEKAIEKYKGKLQGKMAMIEPPRELRLQTRPANRTFTDAELAAEALAPDPSPRSPFAFPVPRPPFDREAMQKRRMRRIQFLKDEGVLLVITPGERGDGGTIFATAGGSREAKDPVPPPMVAIAAEQYNRVVRLLEKKIPVRLEFDIEARFHEDNLDGFNVIAEIPGGRKKDEAVILGAHLDSWTGGTGATDNAAGCAVMMEAMRILKALGLPMDRTVRVALWSAEEGGFLGSRGYVKEHFADRKTMAVTAEHAKLAAYFNVDNGAGKIRGVYLQGNDMVRPIFRAWLEPFHDMGATTLSIRNTGGTDHLAFDEVGLPGFQFIQDPLEYGTRTHHSNMDVFDRVPAGNLMEMSAIVASFAYHAATREEMLPRKPLPKPEKKEKKDAKKGSSL